MPKAMQSAFGLGLLVVLGIAVILAYERVPLGELFSKGADGEGPLTAADVPRLVADLDSGDGLAKLRALKDLHKMGPAANAAIPRLSRELSDGNPSVRHLVVEAIKSAKPTAEQTREILKTVPIQGRDLNNDGSRLVQALERTAVSEELARWLASREEPQRLKAAQLLNSLGDVPAAHTALIAALADESPQVGAEAAYALDRCAEERCVMALIAGLKSSARDVRHGCCFALRQLGTAAGRARDRLEDLMGDADGDTAMDAALAYAAVGGERTAAARVLADVVKRKRSRFAWQAADGLGKLGVDTPEIREVLREAGQGDDAGTEGLAGAAREALGALSGVKK
jgi:HEAT repeat protein